MAYPFWLTKLLVRTGLARYLPRVRRLTDGAGPFLHYYSNRVLAAPYPALRAATPFFEAHGPDTIDLALGTPRFDLTPSGSTKLPADRRGWPPPWGLAELRAAVVDKLATDNQLNVSPEDGVLITAGAAGAFHLAVDTFVNPGDAVVLFDPTSPLYALALRQRRTRIRWVTTWAENGRVRFETDELVKALHGARLVVVNSPANPTGAMFGREDLERLAWWAERRDVLLVSDEVFEGYRYEGQQPSLGTLPKAANRTLTLGSVSQRQALASARVGWLAGHRHLVRPCLLTALLQAPFVPTLCQQIALAALRQDRSQFARIRADFEARRNYTCERLRAMDWNPSLPAGAYFFWLPVWQFGLSGTAFAEGLLQTHRVLVTPGAPFGPSGAGHVRLSYAGEEGRLREGLSRLAEYVGKLQGKELAVARLAA